MADAHTTVIVAGIDPGLTGAIALLEQSSGELIETIDMPTLTGSSGKGEVNAAEVAHLLASRSVGHCKIELVNAQPARPSKPGERPRGMGAASAFNFGRDFGKLLGICAALEIPYTLVTPVKWKRAANVAKRDKDYARTVAQQLYPTADLARKKDIGRADAILIARFG
ncbi:MAG: hypothetical protein AAGI24_04195 [Pseudomonadota bacterium]